VTGAVHASGVASTVKGAELTNPTTTATQTKAQLSIQTRKLLLLLTI
jgi:hypothetical protein